MINRSVLEAYNKMQTSHEIMAYQYNYYVKNTDSKHQVCINEEWENELNLIKATLETQPTLIELKNVYDAICLCSTSNSSALDRGREEMKKILARFEGDNK